MGAKTGCGASSSSLMMASLSGGHFILQAPAFSTDRRKNLSGLASAPSAVGLQHTKKQPRSSAALPLAITLRYGESAVRFQVLAFYLLNDSFISTRQRLPKVL